jgi:tetratricopeptide (TPR) repeat protein
MKLLVWPHPLTVFYNVSSTPTWLAVIPQLALLAVAIFGLARERHGFALGLGFFYLAILPSSRIVGESFGFPLMAERFLYLPSVALSIVLAYGLAALASRWGARPAWVLALAIIIAMTPLTWARNSDWSSNVALMRSAVEVDPDFRMAGAAYVEALVGEDQYSEAARFCDRNRLINSRDAFELACGEAYAFTRQVDKAIAMFTSVSGSRQGDYDAAKAHFSLGVLYADLGDRKRSAHHFEQAVACEPQPFMKDFRRALMLLRLHPRDRGKLQEARDLLARSVQAQPQFFVARRELAELDARLTGQNDR